MGSDSHSSVPRRSVLKTVGAGLAAGSTGLAGCLGGGGGGGGGVSSIKVGHLAPRSSVFGRVGPTEEEAFDLAMSDLQEEYDVEIDVVTADTEVNPETALSRMKRLVTEDEVDYVCGGSSTSVVNNLSSWATNNSVLYFPTNAGDPTTGSNCKKYTFRMWPTLSMLTNAVGSQMVNEADSWFVIYADYSAGVNGYETMKTILENNGKEVVGSVAAPFGAGDFTQYLNQAESSGADGLALAVYGGDKNRSVNQFVNRQMYQDMNLAGQFLEEAAVRDLGKEVVSKMGVWASLWSPSNPANQEFAQRVVDEIGVAPEGRHYSGYTIIDQPVRAMQRAGSKNPDDVRAELEGHEIENENAPTKGTTPYWRECDHQLIQEVSTVRARSVDQMQDDPYPVWYDHINAYPGDEVARTCEETGCSFE